MSDKPIIATVEEFELIAERFDSTHDSAEISSTQFSEQSLMDAIAKNPKDAYHVKFVPTLSNRLLLFMASFPEANVRRELVSRFAVNPVPNEVRKLLLDDLDERVRIEAVDPGSYESFQAAKLMSAMGRDINRVGDKLKHSLALHWQDYISIEQRPFVGPYELNVADPTQPPVGLPFDSERLLWISKSGLAPQSELTRCGESDDFCERLAAARSPFSPKRVLAALSLDPEGSIRAAIRENPAADLPTVLLGHLEDGLSGWYWNKRAILMGIPSDFNPVPMVPRFGDFEPITNVSDLSDSVRSIDGRLRARFATISPNLYGQVNLMSPEATTILMNRTTPNEVVRDIVAHRVAQPRDQYPHCRFMAGRIPTLYGRHGLAELLVTLQDWRVHSELVRADNTPMDVIVTIRDAALLESYNLGYLNSRLASPVSRPFRRRRRFQKRTAEDIERSRLDIGEPWYQRGSRTLYMKNRDWQQILQERPDLAKWVAINETVGPKLLDELADWPGPEVRGWVADHRRIWIKTLIRLANDPDPDVRRYATYNAKMPDGQLRKLAQDPETATREEAQRRLEIRAFADQLLKDPEWWRYLGNSPF